MITSTSNAKVKEIIRLRKNAKDRSRKDLFVVEGPKMFREIPSGMCREVFVSESFLRSQEGALAAETALRHGAVVETVSDEVFRHLSDTKSPQGILAAAKQFHYELRDLLAEGTREAPLIVILENLQDPGNLGTILRSAEAAGSSGILLSRDCADVYNPKVTRSTMGSIFRVPFVYAERLDDAIYSLKKQGVRMLAAHLKGSVDLYEESCVEPTAFLIGNESRGLTDRTAALASQAVRIPMSGRVESLNAAVAASVMLYEARRQRSCRLPGRQ